MPKPVVLWIGPPINQLVLELVPVGFSQANLIDVERYAHEALSHPIVENLICRSFRKVVLRKDTLMAHVGIGVSKTSPLECYDVGDGRFALGLAKDQHQEISARVKATRTALGAGTDGIVWLGGDRIGGTGTSYLAPPTNYGGKIVQIFLANSPVAGEGPVSQPPYASLAWAASVGNGAHWGSVPPATAPMPGETYLTPKESVDALVKALDAVAGRSNFNEFIQLLKKVETRFSNPGSFLRALVGIAGYANWKFFIQYEGLVDAGWNYADYTAFDNDNSAEVSRLRELLGHTWDLDVESGVIEIHGRQVAMGHVFTGMLAGLDHTQKLVDNVFFVTLSGDLGQHLLIWNCGGVPLGRAPSCEATPAELRGDLDGLLLGIEAADAAKPISERLTSYYSDPNIGIRRIESFLPFAQQLEQQVDRFYTAWCVKSVRKWMKSTGKHSVADIVNQFWIWALGELV